ncbi:SGNH/GDSL hydrolase family protein [Sorangium sp. So ce1389]|uniref:SGNH/GDSL hydrolase family protein n=1 Tax=Sorangium sp. So ce1389 TaxID=3133336 RepID=UPI003F622EC1
MQSSSAASGGETSGTGGGSGECVKGQTSGNQVAVIGESFIAATHGITQQIEKQAKANGSLAENERYIDNSVSGTTLANDQIPSQYRQAAENGMIKYVLMDGGGNDCLLRGDGDAALAAAESLFETMAEDKVEKVVYFFYPDPIGNQFASLKSCLDTLRPKMKELCDGLTSPKCYWLDLRPVWDGHNEYTQDGIHPTSAGSIATGDAVWESMVANCVAQ